MAAQRIAENLAFINWTILAALGLGAFAAVVLARWRPTPRAVTSPSRGLLRPLFGLLAYLSDSALPTGVGGTAAVAINPAFDGARRASLLAFSLLALAYTVVVARRGRAHLLGIAGRGRGHRGTFAFGALGWGGGFPALVALLGQSLLLAAATGGVFASMILGHWYLVTPKLPEAPARAVCPVAPGVVALQLVFFVVSVALGAGSGGAPFAPLTGHGRCSSGSV